MKIDAIIPATSNNRYSELGDLGPWGQSTLLDWKLSQLKEVSEISSIVVTTDSDQAADVALKAGVRVHRRKKNATWPQIVRLAVAESTADSILWINTTAPFLGPKDIRALIVQYGNRSQRQDCAVTAQALKEYFYSDNRPMNFGDTQEIFSRDSLEPIYQLTNGAYLAPQAIVSELGRPFGQNPAFYETDWLSSLEIKDSLHMDMFTTLISKYFEKELGS